MVLTLDAMLACPYCAASNTGALQICTNCGGDLALDNTVLPPGTGLRHGQYKILGLLGRGGFGITYRATDTTTGQVVAIKESFPDGDATRDNHGQVQANAGRALNVALQKFLQEGQTLRRLRHPNATKLLRTWQENNTAYMALELIDGESLEQKIARQERLSDHEALHIMQNICAVLEELHAKRLVHRDIKPANIMVGDLQSNTRVELIDYGSVTTFKTNGRMQQTTKLVTPQYAPLEQFASETRLGPPSDFYALGATIYEALTLHAPPSAPERATGKPLAPIQSHRPDVHPAFAALVESMLEMEIAKRPSSTKQVRKRISKVKRALGDRLPKKPTSFFSVRFFALMVGLLFSFVYYWKSDSPETLRYLAPARFYVVPVWNDAQSQPRVGLLLNFRNRKGQRYRWDIAWNFAFENTFSWNQKNNQDYYAEDNDHSFAFQFDLGTLEAGIPRVKVRVASDPVQNTSETSRFFPLQSPFATMPPITNLRAYWNAKTEEVMFKWDAPRNAKNYVFRSISNPRNGLETPWLGQQQKPLFRLHSSTLRDLDYKQGILVSAFNFPKFFVEDGADVSTFAVSQIQICPGWNLEPLKNNPGKVFSVKTSPCTQHTKP